MRSFILSCAALLAAAIPALAQTGTNCNIVANHTVVSGETLGGIAKLVNETVDQLVFVNNITNADFINVGQVILIPDSRCQAPAQPIATTPTATCVNGTQSNYTVVSGDTFTIIANQRLNITLKALEDANTQITNFDSIFVGEVINVPLCGSSKTRRAESVRRNSGVGANGAGRGAGVNHPPREAQGPSNQHHRVRAPTAVEKRFEAPPHPGTARHPPSKGTE